MFPRGRDWTKINAGMFPREANWDLEESRNVSTVAALGLENYANPATVETFHSRAPGIVSTVRELGPSSRTVETFS